MTASKIVAAVLVAALLAGAGAIGYLAGRKGTPQAPPSSSGASAAQSGPKVLYWKAPMDPNFRSDKPGKSPMGMDLVPVYAGEDAGGGADVTVSAAVVNNLSVRTAPVKRGTLARRIESVGYVGYDEDTLVSLHTRAEGWLEKLAVKSEGDRVATGELLYELFSPKLATAEQEYLTAVAGGGPALIRSSEERLRALGFGAAQIDSLKRTRKVETRVAQRADASGVVVALGVRQGAYVTPATEVMKLARLDAVWMFVEIDESEAGLVAKGQRVEAHFDAFPGRAWQGVVDYVYPDVSTMTRTIKVRIRIDNPEERLQPNMFGHAVIRAAPRPDVTYIPTQALIRTGQSQRVIVALGGGRFDVCPVEAGFESGDVIEVRRGLEPGQDVVVSAQFLIDSEANVDAAALRLDSGKAGCGGTEAGGSTKGKADMKDMPAAKNPAARDAAAKDMPAVKEARP